MSDANESAAVQMTQITPPERSRIYTFPNGTVQLAGVSALNVRDSGTHRLKTTDGKLHIVPVGWLHIEIDADGWTL